MWLIHFDSCCPCMEPHSVNHLSHILWPLNLIHLLNHVVLNDLLVHRSFSILLVSMQSAWFIVEALVKLIWEDCILIDLSFFKPMLIWMFSSNHLFLFEWLNQEFVIFPSGLFWKVIKMDYLLIVFSFTKRARFNEVTEASGLCELVDKCVRFRCIFFSSKLVKVEEITWVCHVRNWAILIQTWVLNVSFVVVHDCLHKF